MVDAKSCGSGARWAVMEDSVGTRPESVVNRRGSWGWGPFRVVVAAKAPIWGSPRGLCWFLKKSSILYHLIVSATRFPFSRLLQQL